MPLATVQSFLQTALDGLQAPDAGGLSVPPLTALMGPATNGDADGPHCYVRAKSWKTTRLSLSVPGTKQTVWQLALTVGWAMPVGPPGGLPAAAFASVVDAVTALLDRLPKQAQVDGSIVGLIGNTVSGELQGPWAQGSQRVQVWRCPLTAQVKELYSA